MPRSPALSALLARYGIDPCGLEHCIFGERPGTHGCRCITRIGEAPVSAYLALAAIIRELDRQPEQIAAWLEREEADDTHRGRAASAFAEAVRAGRWKEQG